MRLILFLIFPFLFSCSHEPTRSIASRFSPVDQNLYPENSTVYLVSKKKFLVQAKNRLYEDIDLDKKDIVVRNTIGNKVSFDLQKVSEGKYYIIPDSKNRSFEITVQGKVLGKKFKVADKHPAPKYTYFTIAGKSNHSVELVLRLADENNKPIESDEIPEIIIEGPGIVEGLRYLGKGVWEFSLKHADHNLILYLSVRSHDVYLNRIFRFQHVEK